MKTSFFFYLLLIVLSGCLSADPSALRDLSGDVPGAGMGGNGNDGPTAGNLGLPLVIPQLGSTTVATNVTIRGVDFTPGVMEVEFGGVPCLGINVISTTQITCTVEPQVAGAVPVVVKKNGNIQFELTSGFIFVPEPGSVFGLVSISPYIGPTVGGTSLTIIGSGFTGAVDVSVGGNPCGGVNVISSSLLTCTTPAGAIGARDVVITKGAETVTATAGFNYVGDPTLSTVLPASGAATLGTNVTLSGSNFVSGAIVTISTTAGTYYCQNVNVAPAGTSLTCLIPAISAGIAQSITTAANVTVINPDGQSSVLNSSFTYLQPPVYSSQSFTGGVSAPPVDGVLSNLGTAIQWNIAGQNFQAGVEVRVNGVVATNCTRLSTTLIRCLTSIPNLGSNTSNFPLTIANVDGQFDTNVITFAGRPAITSTSPSIAPTNTAGYEVMLVGENIASHNGSNPNIRIRNAASSAELGVCTVVSNLLPSCTLPNLASAQNTTIRFTNSYGYTADYQHLTFDFLAQVLIAYPAHLGDAGGTTKLGRIPLGGVYRIGARLSNLSGTYPVTDLSFDTSSLSNTSFSLDTDLSTCTNTITPAGNCELYIKYEGSELRAQDAPEPIIIHYNNGGGMVSSSISLGSVMTIPLKVSRSSLNFGNINFGNNHNGKKPKMLRVLQVHNRSDRSLTIDTSLTNFDVGTQFRFAGGGSFPGITSDSYSNSTACPSTGILPANMKCSIFIEFIPATSGVQADRLEIQYNGGMIKEVSLSGESSSSTSNTCDPVASPFGAGSGTIGSPYLICSLSQFESLVTNLNSVGAEATWRTYNYKLTDDINISSIGNFTLNFSSAGASGGSFDGGGFALRQPSGNTSIFNINGSTVSIKNLHIDSFNTSIAASGSGFVFTNLTTASTSLTMDNVVLLGELARGSSLQSNFFGGVSSGDYLVEQVQILSRVTGASNQGGTFIGLHSGGNITAKNIGLFGVGSGGGFQSGVSIGALSANANLILNDYVTWKNANFLSPGLVSSLIGNAKLLVDRCEINSDGLDAGLIYSFALTTVADIEKCGFFGNHSLGLIPLNSSPNLHLKQSVHAGHMIGTTTTSGLGGHWNGGSSAGWTAGFATDLIMTHRMTGYASVQSGALFQTALSVYENTILTNVYVGWPLNERSLFGPSVTTAVNSWSQTMPSTNICSSCFYQTGIGNNLNPDPTKVNAVAKSQMMSFLPEITNGANWRTDHYDSAQNIGYPYPILDWMDDDFMP
jgi:hypothetical protein